MQRRSFLKTSVASLALASLKNDDLFGAKKSKYAIGVQLYSVRADMMKDPEGTLKQIAAMGYKNVEHAYYVNSKFYKGWSAKEFKQVLDDLGLKMPSGHTVFNKNHWDFDKKQLTDEWKQLVEDAVTVGQKYIISPWLDAGLRKNFDDLKRFMDAFNANGQYCKSMGAKFGYHNHDFEFSLRLTSTRVYDIIMQNTDPNLVAQQLDIGNMYGGGGRAVELLNAYPGRFELMHVKDVIANTKGTGGFESAILGTGLIGVKEVIDLGRKKGGTTQLIIEQESYQSKAPLDCIKENLAVMKKWKY